MKEARPGNPPPSLPVWVRQVDERSWQLYVYVQPGAKKSEVSGEMEGRLRLRIAAQAVDNKANKALTAYVAKLLGVRPNRVRLESGETSRKKTLLVTDVTECDWSAVGASDVPS